MPEKISQEEYKTAFIHVLKEDRKRSFYLHLTVYITINMISAIINFLFTPQLLWVIFPVIFWGLGIIWNFISVFILIDRKMDELSLKTEYIIKNKN